MAEMILTEVKESRRPKNVYMQVFFGGYNNKMNKCVNLVARFVVIIQFIHPSF